MRFTLVAKAGGVWMALSFFPAFIMHARRTAQTRLREELYVQACSLGENRAICALSRTVLQALIRRQNDPLARPSQPLVRRAGALGHRGSGGEK